jgi:hypothetical protein
MTRLGGSSFFIPLLWGSMLTLTKAPRTHKIYAYRATSNRKSTWVKVGAATLLRQTVTLILVAAGLLLATPQSTQEVAKIAAAQSAPVVVETVANSPSSAPVGTVDEVVTAAVIPAIPIDTRVQKLGGYLHAQGSPFAENAADFVTAADRYGLDWKLIPAISGVESGFGHAYIVGTYNAWGWGGGYIHFSSWTDAIFKISGALRDNYANHGLITPQEIGPVYAPPSYSWASNVQMYMDRIGNF